MTATEEWSGQERRSGPRTLHVPVVARRGEWLWGVYCLACSHAVGDYVETCRLSPQDWPPVLLTFAGSSP